MQGTSTDPRCPECGEPIGQRATYCMHCSADLTEERAAADVDGDGAWDRPEEPDAATEAGAFLGSVRRAIADALSSGRETAATEGEGLLDPEGLVDDTLTVVVGIAAGVVLGLLVTIELLAMTGSSWTLPLGLLAWLGATAYLVRRRTVQAAVAASAYGVALVLMLVPLLAFSPVAEVEGGLPARGGLFVLLVAFVGVPVVVAAAIGWVASRL